MSKKFYAIYKIYTQNSISGSCFLAEISLRFGDVRVQKSRTCSLVNTHSATLYGANPDEIANYLRLITAKNSGADLSKLKENP